MAIKLSEQGKIVAAGNAVKELDSKARTQGMRIDQVNVALVGADGNGIGHLVFEWDSEAGEYTVRTL